MPNGAVSAARTRVKPSTANFAAWYDPSPGVPPTRPPIDENCTTVPARCAFRIGSAAVETL